MLVHLIFICQNITRNLKFFKKLLFDDNTLAITYLEQPNLMSNHRKFGGYSSSYSQVKTHEKKTFDEFYFHSAFNISLNVY